MVSSLTVQMQTQAGIRISGAAGASGHEEGSGPLPAGTPIVFLIDTEELAAGFLYAEEVVADRARIRRICSAFRSDRAPRGGIATGVGGWGLALSMLNCVGARELGEHERTGPLHLAHGGELVGDEVHSVTEGCDKGHIGRAVEHGEFGLVVGAVAVADRLPVALGERPVDAADGFVHLALELVVALDARSAGRGDLHEGDAPVCLGVALEERFKTVEAEEQALRVVEPVHGGDEALGTDGLAELPGLAGRRLARPHRLEALGVDADREDARAHTTIPIADELPLPLQTENSPRRGVEVPPVRVGVETDQIRPQDALEQGLAGVLKEHHRDLRRHVVGGFSSKMTNKAIQETSTLPLRFLEVQDNVDFGVDAHRPA